MHCLNLHVNANKYWVWHWVYREMGWMHREMGMYSRWDVDLQIEVRVSTDGMDADQKCADMCRSENRGQLRAAPGKPCWMCSASRLAHSATSVQSLLQSDARNVCKRT